MSKTPKKTRWHSCNVLQTGPVSRHLWAFEAARGGFTLAKEQTVPAADPLPARYVSRDWKTLFQPRLNIAWLPADKVFLRVVQLPAGSFEETLAMVELQLEKLSPLPVTQIVWSLHILPRQTEDLQTIILVIASRDLVQELLGQLERGGYLADRLECPMLHQLLASPTDDGAWIFPGNEPTKLNALVAWWQGGDLKNLALLHIAPGEKQHESLREQLTQMTWAGELEGWLAGQPKWRLVADAATATTWQAMFQAWLGKPVAVSPPLPLAKLASLTAERVAQAPAKPNILPPEFSTRYQQVFVDRLWLRGLMGVLGIYALGVAVYFGLLGYQTYRTGNAEKEMHDLSRDYTNTLQLKAQMAVLEDRQALKYAALACWNTTALLIPENLTLQSLEFRNGHSLSLNGLAPSEDDKLIIDFSEAMSKATYQGEPLFDKVELPIIHNNPSAKNATWSFNCELAHSGEDAPK